MNKITPIIKTTFKVPPRQGKDIYSPNQRLITDHKMPGKINRDTIEFSTYNREHAEKTLNILTDLKAKFNMITEND